MGAGMTVMALSAACFPACAGMTINYGNDGQLKEGSQVKERA